MASAQTFRFPSLLQRELREYRTSLVWTPLVTALLLALLMLSSVLLVNRVSVIGDTILDALMADGGSSVEVSISVGENGDDEATVIEVTSVDPARDPSSPADPAITQGAGEPPTYEVIPEGDDERWNFSREWTFDPEPAGDEEEGREGQDAEDKPDELEGRELNVMLSIIHSILLLTLFITSSNYLLSSLFEDRKDRSILFWRSMPVTEWENIGAKLIVALIVAPIIYIFISILLQFVYVVLMTLLVKRMGRDPSEVVLSNIDFLAVILDPISGWVMTALWIAPVYAWFLLASSLARRSPVGLALLLPVGLFVVEGVFIGTEYIGDAITAHFPHLSDDSAVGFYLFGPDWMAVDFAGIGAGWVFAILALLCAVWLRTHRWEIN